jgi:zinc protease
MLDRKIAPESRNVDSIHFLEPDIHVLDNGIKVYTLNAGSQEVTKIDFIFEAGSWYQSKRLLAGLTNAFLNQGTRNWNAQHLAELFDSRGAYFQPTADQHFGNLNILTLNRYLEKILAATSEIVKFPIFPEAEINTQLAKKKQLFTIENNKVKVLAQKAFSKTLFGDGHPYANNNQTDDFDQLSRTDFISFHQCYYSSNRCKILISGKLEDNTLHLLNQYFGKGHWGNIQSKQEETFPIHSRIDNKQKIIKPGALQSAIRVGKLLPNREHADFFGLSILTTILGGYFGSRLMTNIREDKGYTYGIGANIITYPKAAYLSISSEIGSEVCQAALDEVYIEIKRLQDELVSIQELEMVRNYLLGELLRSFDGIFAISSSFKVLLDSGLDYQHYRNYLDVLKTITPEMINHLARKYFDPESMFEVIAG